MGSDDDVTPELTGTDASPDEASIGSAGNGASPFGPDTVGGIKDIEDTPLNDDILPDQVKRWAAVPTEDEVEITARPTEHGGYGDIEARAESASDRS